MWERVVKRNRVKIFDSFSTASQGRAWARRDDYEPPVYGR
ncbi:hypothetical protein FHU29_003685 [Hoyosella altamirensis]|uniref:Uncharacterized protein n=1 Tax=Hoyosella altamirensis TaxID=616997 RepID=A0A839RST5_9ACTN|nr:hypothetical protein [Hoyosella altamirensis]